MTDIDIEWQNALHTLGVNRDRLAVWSKDLGDPWLRQRLESLVSDHDACRYAFDHATRLMEQVPILRRRRRVAQRSVDRLESSAPPRWRFRQRSHWEAQRRTRWGRLRRAVRSEQEAVCGLPQAVQPMLISRVRVLSGQTDAVEAVLRDKLSTEVVIRDAVKSTQGHQPFTPKATHVLPVTGR